MIKTINDVVSGGTIIKSQSPTSVKFRKNTKEIPFDEILRIVASQWFFNSTTHLIDLSGLQDNSFCNYREHISEGMETTLASEQLLLEDWDTDEEDEAWKDLLKVM